MPPAGSLVGKLEAATCGQSSPHAENWYPYLKTVWCACTSGDRVFEVTLGDVRPPLALVFAICFLLAEEK